MRQRTRKRPISDINVVPYIDVMLVLLIIFMITTPLLSQGIDIDLPQIASEPIESQNQEPVIVSVDRDGKFYISFGENQDKPLSSKVLVNRINALLKYRPGIPVYLESDKNVPYGKVVELMALLQSANVPSIGILTESPEN